ncbi:hypothetical protein BLD44_007255 [Mastigocladus laminosus UU774]|nr:hypothetical protein BLD44_007255 [Mastigocladus laminosus UU774]
MKPKRRKQSVCRICKKNPIWHYKNSDGTVCKRCYHKHIWVERFSLSKSKKVAVNNNEVEEVESPKELIFDGYTGEYYSTNQYW